MYLWEMCIYQVIGMLLWIILQDNCSDRQYMRRMGQKYIYKKQKQQQMIVYLSIFFYGTYHFFTVTGFIMHFKNVFNFSCSTLQGIILYCMFYSNYYIYTFTYIHYTYSKNFYIYFHSGSSSFRYFIQTFIDFYSNYIWS